MRHTKVINIFGAPSSGKSTVRAGLFSLLKKEYQMAVEEVTEYAKDLVWDNHINVLKDQIMVFAEQNHRQERLRGQVDYIITDSPILLPILYYKVNGCKQPESLLTLIHDTWLSYENVNIMLTRHHPFDNVGRVQGTDEQANQIHDDLVKLLSDLDVDYVNVSSNDPDLLLSILSYVQTKGQIS